MSDNYYEYLFGKSMAIAEDAEVMRKHPDGSPCYAKEEKDCPILNKNKQSENADDLGSDTSRHLGELYTSTLPQIMKQVPGAENLTYSQLEEAYVDLQEQSGAWKPEGKQIMQGTRAARDKVFEQHKDESYESFDLATGQKVTDADGQWGVTFHTTSAEEGMSDDEYDQNVAKFSELLGAKPQVGVYEGSCEISYACGSLAKSAAAMVMCDQKAIFGFMRSKTAKKPDEFGVDIVNFTFDTGKNKLEHPNREQYL